MDYEIQKELKRIDEDKVVNQQMIANFKKQFSEELINGQMGYEIKHCNQYPIIKIKKKKSLIYKIKTLLNRIKNTLINTNGIE